jgi:predicted nuclease of restriction endonuclease-like (RecB) superfamily
VKSHDIHIDADYADWIADIKKRYLFYAEKIEKLKQLVLVNGTEKMHQVGAELMRLKLQQVVGELQNVENRSGIKHQQAVGEISDLMDSGLLGMDFPSLFALVPWGHHIEIIAKCKTVEEALFYVSKTAAQNWSRATLINCIKSDLYHASGGAVTNFSDRLSSPQRELAQAITKDTYDFGFLTLEEGYQEEALETELEKQLTRFLLELGTGFSYLGRQKQIIVAGKTRKLDMLFFHIPLNCYVVVELKAVPFQPEFAGKLNFYVNAVDDLIKTEAQNPTIGLLICSNKDETEVQYAFRGVQTPMGVASYNNVQIREIQEQLPSVEELKKRIRLLEEELAEKK